MRISKRVIILLCAAALLAPVLSACDNGGGGAKLYPYDPGEAFVTNFTDSETKKMLKSAVVFEVMDEKIVDTLTERNYVVRDAVIKELSTLSVADATTNKNLEELGTRLVDAANTAVGTPVFVHAYFNEFTVANT